MTSESDITQVAEYNQRLSVAVDLYLKKPTKQMMDNLVIMYNVTEESIREGVSIALFGEK